jgi:hypothetical protein
VIKLTPELIADIRSGMAGVPNGPWTGTDQVGLPGHCSVAQIFGADGKSLALIETTDDPAVASAVARHLANCSPENIGAILDRVEILENLVVNTVVSVEGKIDG